MVTWLDPYSHRFPPVHTALTEPNGLIAAGGDLSADRLIQAYRHGIFPWYNQGEPILWWSPNPRCVLYPDQIHLSHSFKKAAKKANIKLTFDACFDTVVERCSEPRADSEGTWISPAMKAAYAELNTLGVAHSVEVWQEDTLIGGLYGLAIGPFFFGESMFSRASNGSKFAMASLAKQLNRWGYKLIDCQVTNPHLMSMGAIEIERRQFSQQLHSHIDNTLDHPWTFDSDICTSFYSVESSRQGL